MPTLKCGCLILLLTLLWACSDGTNTVTSPTPTPTTPTPTAAPALPPAPPLPTPLFPLAGLVTNRITSAPIPGARVVASYPPVRPIVMTDGLGRYIMTGLPPPGSTGFVWAIADDYETDVHYHRSEVQDFRLYPIQRMTAGDSTVVTLGPDDSLCSTDALGPGWGADVVCRIVRVEVPTGGILTVEALSTGGGPRPLLEVLVSAGGRLLQEVLANPTSLQVPAGTEARAFIAIAATETTKQSFTLNTSLGTPAAPDLLSKP